MCYSPNCCILWAIILRYLLNNKENGVDNMAIEKKNGDIISFFKQKDYIMVNSNLGGGSFGKTVVLKDPYVDELFVAKKYEPAYPEIKELFYKNFIEEIKILYKLNHPNIVRVFNYYPYENSCTGYILMEFIDGVDIGSYFEKYEEFDTVLFNAPSPNDIFLQLIDAFCYIEDRQIIHRDIREGNIMIDTNGMVKVIDFGIGKIFDPEHKEDSLVDEINRASSDTLPAEYYSGEYTSLTDMFYLAELLNRLVQTSPNEITFSYQEILDKMMKKDPSDRFKSFAEIREAIGKHDFTSLEIHDDDKELYQEFSNLLYRSVSYYSTEPKFVSHPNIFIERLQKALRINAFEDYIQGNAAVINGVVACLYTYDNSVGIPCTLVKRFLNWFINSTYASQELILANLTAKLSQIEYRVPEPELPF